MTDWKLWYSQAEDRYRWGKHCPAGDFAQVPTMNKEDLPPDISDADYAAWHRESTVVYGVRFGPKI